MKTKKVKTTIVIEEALDKGDSKYADKDGNVTEESVKKHWQELADAIESEDEENTDIDVSVEQVEVKDL